MANNLVENLGKELEQIDREYATDFAGHSRLTRDVAQMDRMIKRDRCRSSSRSIGSPLPRRAPISVACARRPSRASRSTRRSARRSSRRRRSGPTFEQFSTEATSANFVFARYMRHFAGKDRSTRDVALLGEMVEDLRQIEKRMSAGPRGVARRTPTTSRIARSCATTSRSTRRRSSSSRRRRQSGTPEDQASILATLANNQFAVYQASLRRRAARVAPPGAPHARHRAR